MLEYIVKNETKNAHGLTLVSEILVFFTVRQNSVVQR